MSDPFFFDSDDGLRIAVHSWLPDDEPDAVLQIAHGMSEHGRRYQGLAQALNAEGFAVYACDHRGHGESVPEGEEPGHMADEGGFGRAVGDVHRLSGILAERHPGKPRLMLGHSMGSFMVQRIMARHSDDAKGYLLSASNGKPPPIANAGRLVARAERVRLGRRGKSKVIDALGFRDFNSKFKPNRTDFDWISRDEAEVDAYVADPLCGFMASVQTWIDLLDALPGLTERQEVRKIPRDTPIFMFAGSRDAVGAMGKGMVRLRDCYRDAGLGDVTMKLYPGGRHEMLHETNKDEVVADVVAWCKKTVERS